MIPDASLTSGLHLLVLIERRGANRPWPRDGRLIIDDLARANTTVQVARHTLGMTAQDKVWAQQAHRDAQRFLRRAEANLRRLADELETVSGRAMGT